MSDGVNAVDLLRMRQYIFWNASIDVLGPAHPKLEGCHHKGPLYKLSMDALTFDRKHHRLVTEMLTGSEPWDVTYILWVSQRACRKCGLEEESSYNTHTFSMSNFGYARIERDLLIYIIQIYRYHGASIKRIDDSITVRAVWRVLARLGGCTVDPAVVSVLGETVSPPPNSTV
jgi:hypothetical protein